MITYYEGYAVPCIPKKEWGKWMSNTPHEPCPVDVKMGCVGVCCNDCIYSVSNADVRKEFYEYWYGKWKEEEEELPELSEKVFHCPDCPVKAEYLISDMCGNVWALREDLSKMIKLAIKCKPLSIIMREHKEAPQEKPSCENCKNYSSKDEPKKGLPRLTKEVFDREDCPDWANWAAVDSDGRAAWYSERPEIDHFAWFLKDKNDRFEWIKTPSQLAFRYYDSSEWMLSLIERPKKTSCETCKNFEPEKEIGTIEVSMLNWPTGWKYSVCDDHYYYKYDQRHAQRISFATDMSMVTGETHTRVPSDVLDMPCPLK